jgi:hypothetical protein
MSVFQGVEHKVFTNVEEYLKWCWRVMRPGSTESLKTSDFKKFYNKNKSQISILGHGE